VSSLFREAFGPWVSFEAYIDRHGPAVVHLRAGPNERHPLALLQDAEPLADDPAEVDEQDLAVVSARGA
jgi:hypothetical protein